MSDPASQLPLTVFLLSVCSTPSVAGWFGPSSYDECILESMKGVTSNTAATYIAISCREKFPEKQQPTPEPSQPNPFLEAWAKKEKEMREVKQAISDIDVELASLARGNTNAEYDLFMLKIEADTALRGKDLIKAKGSLRKMEDLRAQLKTGSGR